MLEVLKLTAASGRAYFSKRLGVLELMERVPTWKRIERVHMTELQWGRLTVTEDAGKVFK